MTDGPYLETKEYLASFYLLDCESEERALEIAAEMPDADAGPVEVRPVMLEAKRGYVSVLQGGVERLLRELAPQVLGVLVRRHGAVRPVRGRGPGGAARRRAQWPR